MSANPYENGLLEFLETFDCHGVDGRWYYRGDVRIEDLYHHAWHGLSTGSKEQGRSTGSMWLTPKGEAVRDFLRGLTATADDGARAADVAPGARVVAAGHSRRCERE